MVQQPHGISRGVAGALVRLAIYVALALLVGSILTRLSSGARSNEPAGFGRGMVEGALMPMAFPNLLLGRDVPIYAENNAGVSYKLGYTAGVNLCGAIFFGLLFYRLLRIGRFLAATPGINRPSTPAKT